MRFFESEGGYSDNAYLVSGIRLQIKKRGGLIPRSLLRVLIDL